VTFKATYVQLLLYAYSANSGYGLASAAWRSLETPDQGSFPARTPPKVILTVGTAFPGTQLNQANQL